MADAEKAPAKKHPVPPPGIVPYITSPNPLEHIDWLERVFGAELKTVLWADLEGKPVESEWKDAKVDLSPHAKGWKILHAELLVNGAALYLSDHKRVLAVGHEALPSEQLRKGGRGFMCTMFVDDVQQVWKAAIEAKATVKLELNFQFWGAWFGIFMDPFGYEWSIAQYGDESS